MSRITTLTLAGLTAASLTVTAVSPVQAAPLPAMSAAQVGGGPAVETVGWRRGYYGGYYGPRYGYGYGYRRRNVAGALFAGAALGLIGGAIAASAAPRYYGYPAYGGYYGYGVPVGYYGGYGYPVYGGYYGYGPYGW
ncbi:MAG: hypothetical protein ACAH20_08770 [Methylobacteriaceae bacterium]|jgi:hypothetical protein|uniref:Transmembrane protein n=1 Tax=Methylorubrum extorquens (strain CM4 / NCIMB 13688) TaxID=440085 RepID=B7L1Z0_METC4|nr:hypothetical protein [Methylorubrum extorquens]KQO80653.1 hypothetical protein ASF36_10680 [Methylobacterium sp. Leaf90]KQP89489.1 hypothetical protein ASF55_23795 [Methylobacterium sp. Leaf119]ABY29307.1 conserved hypothetical protein [Methylorubrum extorquens PA1]ACK81780.1 conserved hypothetical protein [Methylorubrum extorquens CM4]APX83867.1 hypothetical protein BV511_03475 [Methylorubrum extorquens]